MSILAWTDDLKINIKEIDSQHQNLVTLVNKLYDAMKIGKGKDVLAPILSELINYTEYHFSTEESLMKNHNYPVFLEHEQEHKKLVSSVLDFDRKFKKGEITVSMELFKFLNNWLVEHILGVDKKMGVFLVQKGLR
jgi:hemerythrin-like metal-binding protein